ncbi:MAG: acyl-CoA thioesterase [Desulfobacterales bacterium]|jgi:acyl-CoA thioesterase YciA|nr:acyl-CoA thioesterase [Desulfobacter sp.]MDP6681948.1 acyl-CoA thioesterase [Desulfobacterales bacterium]MDP6808276.1 acyl-CoA thioesterase [Desulfobacterales bacterium]|tara:strand:- start:40292 stop:40732 length:441 start_codon:yes stop_codon:yes gene_type:complete
MTASIDQLDPDLIITAPGDPDPKGKPAIRTLAMPADTNPSGDVFGGWLLSQMDLAAGISAAWHARGRVATVAVQGMEFHRPVRVGDVLCVYADVVKVGRTSITLLIEAYVLRSRDRKHRVKVTEGVFTCVAIDENGKPRPVPSEEG